MEETLCKKCNGSGKRWGLKVGTGSMGMGLSFAVGFALAKKLKGEEGKVYVLMSDGEMQCGTTWESALIAAHHKLDNLIVLVDNNGFQAMGETQKILGSKFPEDGWNRHWELDGHNLEEIEYAINRFKELGTPNKIMYVAPEDWCNRGRPTIINFKTIKGKGVSFMENNNEWHYRAPNKDEYERACAELEGVI